jgi:hypothetical protein
METALYLGLLILLDLFGWFMLYGPDWIERERKTRKKRFVTMIGALIFLAICSSTIYVAIGILHAAL